MKRKMKGLLALWLAILMVVAIPVTSLAASNYWAGFYTGTQELTKEEETPWDMLEGFQIQYGEDADTIDNQIAMAGESNSNITTNHPGYIYNGWRLWGAYHSIETDPIEKAIGDTITDDDITTLSEQMGNGNIDYFIIEPIYENKYKFSQQPAEDNGYTVVTQTNSGNDVWTDNTSGVDYEWYAYDLETDEVVGTEAVNTGDDLDSVDIESNTYICKATFEDDFVLYSEPVEYTAPVYPGVYVGGVNLVVDTNYVVVDGAVVVSDDDTYAAKVTYDDEAGYTLNIKALVVSGDAGVANTLGAAIYSENSYTINVEGKNTVTGALYEDSESFESTYSSFGIVSEQGDIKIVGKGTLIANVAEGCDRSIGIYASSGDVAIENAAVTATSGEATDISFGLYAGHNVKIYNNTVIAETTAENAMNKGAIYAQELNFTDENGEDGEWYMWRLEDRGDYTYSKDEQCVIDDISDEDYLEITKYKKKNRRPVAAGTVVGGGGTSGGSSSVEKDNDANGSTGGKLPFKDVDGENPYYKAIEYVYLNKLMNGTSATNFAPDEPIDRAMIVTILWRNEGSPEVEEEYTFTDVQPDSYYCEAVAWAQKNGIVNGYSDNVFKPEQIIIREQLAAIMYRYAQYKGYDVSVGEETNILSYMDAERISEYAIPAVQYALGSGIMKAKDAFNPDNQVTRGDYAETIMAFVEYNKK